MLEPIAPGTAEPRAFLRVGGHSVARQQLAIALALGCERVICIARGLPGELVELQHRAERGGAQFNAVGGAHPLVGLITAADDVIMLGDSLFAGLDEAAALLDKGPGVLVQPIEQGLTAGFERIDLNHASAAAMRLPGRLIERLADLPADCDAFSTLQRIALQAGVPQRAIGASAGGAQFWTLVRGEADAHVLEPRWIRQQIGGEATSGPGRWLAKMAVQAFGPALLHAGNGAQVIVFAAITLAALGLGAGWFGLAALGLGFCALGWVLRQAAVLLARIEGIGPVNDRLIGLRREIYGWTLDAVVVAIISWASVIEPGQSILHRYFPPLMLMALVRIVPRTTSLRWTGVLEDRMVLCLLLVGAVLAGMSSDAVHVGAVMLAVVGIAVPRGEMRLTRP